MMNPQLPVINNLSKIITSHYPRVNKQNFTETSIEKTYIDRYLPVNNYEQDGFAEFRIPATVGIFTDLSQLLLDFHILIKKKVQA